jgi:hypothetical protein
MIFFEAAIILSFACATITVPVLLVALSVVRVQHGQKTGKIIWSVVGGISCLPILYVLFMLGWLVAANAPFTSGVVAYSSTPDGDEACVVQSSSLYEYQVSLFARHRGKPWHRNYLGHEEDRWRNCRVEFAGDALRVFRAGTLQKTFSIAEATEESSFNLPANYTPTQICAAHNGETP